MARNTCAVLLNPCSAADLVITKTHTDGVGTFSVAKSGSNSTFGTITDTASATITLGASVKVPAVNGSTISNTALMFSAVTLAGALPGDYKISSNTCTNASVAPGASCAIGVQFAPLALGGRNASLRLEINSVGTMFFVALDGRGVSPTATGWGSNTNGQLGDGTTATKRAPVQVLGPGGAWSLTNVTARSSVRYISLGIPHSLQIEPVYRILRQFFKNGRNISRDHAS